MKKELNMRLRYEDGEYFFQYTFETLTMAETLFYRVATNIETMLYEYTGEDNSIAEIAKEVYDKKHALTPSTVNTVIIKSIPFHVQRISQEVFVLSLYAGTK